MNLETFAELLPEHPYCARRKGEMLITSQKQARAYPLVQPNHPYFQRFITLDVDSDDAVLAWENYGVPPNLVVENPETSHAHYIYWLDKPIWIRPGDLMARPVQYLAAVKRGLVFACGSDASYSGALVQNPLHPAWRTHVFRSAPYKLGDIGKHVDLSIRPGTHADDLGRNCMVFNRTRYWAYRHLHEYGERALWFSAVESYATSVNDFNVPLASNEIASIAKSVARWVWDRYTGNGKSQLPRMLGLDPGLPLSTRQKLGQTYVASTRTRVTQQAMRDAIHTLVRSGVHPTQVEVARLSKRSLPTIKRQWPSVSSEIGMVSFALDQVIVDTFPDRRPTNEPDSSYIG